MLERGVNGLLPLSYLGGYPACWTNFWPMTCEWQVPMVVNQWPAKVDGNRWRIRRRALLCFSVLTLQDAGKLANQNAVLLTLVRALARQAAAEARVEASTPSNSEPIRDFQSE